MELSLFAYSDIFSRESGNNWPVTIAGLLIMGTRRRVPDFFSIELLLSVTCFSGGSKFTIRDPLITILSGPVWSSPDFGQSIGRICNFLLTSLIGGDASFIESDGDTRCRIFFCGDYFDEMIPFSLL